jgi:hypothetical protein
MHPILGRVARLASYLAVWTVAAVLVAGALTRLDLTWVEALVFLVPLFLVYAFACLSAWYVCRAFPLRGDGLLLVLTSCGLAALTASAVWISVVGASFNVMGSTRAFASGS